MADLFRQGISLSCMHLYLAELFAAWLDIKAAVQELHATNFILEEDSATIVSWLQAQHHSTVQRIPFFQDLQVWVLVPSSIKILHIFRETNQLADYMANAAPKGDFLWCSEADLDSQCKLILYADDYGVHYHRV